MNDNFTNIEIHRQPEIWRDAVAALAAQSQEHQRLLREYREHLWVFTGCGTSFYLAQAAAALFSGLTGLRSKAVPASEILIYPELVFNPHERILTVAFSRSGTTTEIVWAVEKTRHEFGIPTLCISCDPDSPLALAGDRSITFPFPAEQSVVMTGSFTTMLLSLVQAAIQGWERTEQADLLAQIPAAGEALLAQADAILPTIISHSFTQFVFLAQGPFYGLANEAALKMNEMSLSASRSFHALEYRHGPMSTTTTETLITLLLSQRGVEYELKMAADMKKLGAQMLLLHDSSLTRIPGDVDFDFCVPGPGGDLANALLYMPVLQLLGYYNALHRNQNPDQPHNLRAVVTLSL
ncbi:MAG TPA: SIS domain-containing protein [bacterium]|nr:SIS domain-containing protein [bacterium]HQI49139.1 SIS domain-containing protein [bacterium]